MGGQRIGPKRPAGDDGGGHPLSQQPGAGRLIAGGDRPLQVLALTADRRPARLAPLIDPRRAYGLFHYL